MANLTKVIYINEEDYSTLLNGDSITKGSTTYTYDSTALYVIKDVGVPEYAETAGYATNAGTSQVAVTDASGNNIAATYEKRPLIIELQDSDAYLPQGTFNSITEALRNGRIVYLLIYRAIADENTLYLRITNNGLNQDGYYQFSGYCEGSLVNFGIGSQDDFHFNFSKPATDTTVVHKADTETITGNKTFTGTVSLGSNATATTPAAGDNDTSVATTAFVQNAVNSLPTKYWANLQVGTAANYITEPEIKSLKINGSSTNAVSTQNAVIQYDTTNKCIKFVFN